MQDLLSRSRDLSRSGIIRLLCIGVLGMVAFYLCIDGLSRPKPTPTRSLGRTSQLDISSSAQDLEATVRALRTEMEHLESKLASLITELTKSRKSNPKKDESEQIKELLSKIASLEETEFGQNEMYDWFKNYKAGPGAHKYAHYLDAYHRHFKKFREQEKIVMVEVGVQSGGSINLWRDYFRASKLEYYGVDINPKTKQFEKEGKTRYDHMLGDQSNRTFWKELKAQIPPAIDIFIDDGGHQMNQQIVTLEEMFWTVRDGGIYLCEDLHTSYWDEFQGAYLKEDSMIERSKSFVDAINAWHSRDARLKVDRWTESIRGLHFYDSMIFIEKLVTTHMVHVKGGDYWIPYEEHESNRKM